MVASKEKNLRCIHCREPGHANCSKIGIHSKLVYCVKCGEKGHSLDECDNRLKTDYGRDLYRSHIKEVQKDLREASHPDRDRPMGKRERRYWDKVERKAMKEIKQKAKHRAKRRKVVYRGSASESSD